MSLYGDKQPSIGKSNPFESQENVMKAVYFRDESGVFELRNLKWKKLTKPFSGVYDNMAAGSFAKDSNGKAYEAKTVYDAKDEEKPIGTILFVVPLEKRFADAQARIMEELEEEEKAAEAKIKHQKKTPKKVSKKSMTAKKTIKKTEKKKISSVKAKTTKSKEAKKTTRPLNAYMRFAMDERKNITKNHPKMCITDVARELGKRYQKLTSAEKQRYKSLAEKEFKNK